MPGSNCSTRYTRHPEQPEPTGQPPARAREQNRPWKSRTDRQPTHARPPQRLNEDQQTDRKRSQQLTRWIQAQMTNLLLPKCAGSQPHEAHRRETTCAERARQSRRSARPPSGDLGVQAAHMEASGASAGKINGTVLPMSDQVPHATLPINWRCYDRMNPRGVSFGARCTLAPSRAFQGLASRRVNPRRVCRRLGHTRTRLSAAFR